MENNTKKEPTREEQQQRMKEEAAKMILKCDSYILIAIDDNGVCTSKFGDFAIELAASMAIHELVGDETDLYDKVVRIKDAIRSALSIYTKAKNDPFFHLIKQIKNESKNDKWKEVLEMLKKQNEEDAKKASN